MAEMLTMSANDWQMQEADAWVRLSLNGALLLAEFKKPALNASFALHVRQESALFDYVKQRSRLVVDLKYVSVANSSGLALLVELFQAMAPGSHLYILHANVEIAALLRDTYLDQLFPSFDHIHDLPVECIALQDNDLI